MVDNKPLPFFKPISLKCEINNHSLNQYEGLDKNLKTKPIISIILEISSLYIQFQNNLKRKKCKQRHCISQ